jgi:ATP-dependent DNA helicase RecG
VRKTKAKPSASTSVKTVFQEGLDTQVQFCPGVGPKRAQLLRKLHIESVYDIFWHFPRAYEDFHELSSIQQVKVGEIATVQGTVTMLESSQPRGRSKVRCIIRAVIADETGSILAVWFNQSFLTQKIQKGSTVILHGKVEHYDGFAQMSVPKVEIVENDQNTTGILPLYPLTEGLSQGVVRKIVQAAFAKFGQNWKEILPDTIRETYAYPTRIQALHTLHFPQPTDKAPTDLAIAQRNFLMDTGEEEIESSSFIPSGDPATVWGKARQRLAFDEFLLHQLILRTHSEQAKTQTGIVHPMPEPSPWGEMTACANHDQAAWPALFVWNLPYTLTEDQQQVCQELESDMHAPKPMNRLLQGDVGAGKTVVSCYAMMLAVSGGRQAALMTPTEILAQQHADNIRNYTRGMEGLHVVVLSGTMKTKERREVVERIANGSAQIVIGTHALFQESIEFANLGLVVVDEQHKFGVNQRLKLLAKGQHPDLLVATATPIPRTLSLTLFGDMDVSVIASLPPGRPELITRWTHWEKEDKVWAFMDTLIAAGQQIYVVCPIISPSDNAPNLPSTEEAFDKLSATFLAHRRVAILHGRHRSEEKETMMAQLKAGTIDAVIATTVIEVGVDLPNATAMIILGAERFGLAQLHQLRGRVGRGTEKSYCVLVTPNQIADYAQQRMRCMESTRDGFVIAEEDLKLRGPGEHFGTRQSGHVRFRIADPYRDGDLLREAHQVAQQIYRQDPALTTPAHAGLKDEMTRKYGEWQANRPS